jgi:hypothetical protein
MIMKNITKAIANKMYSYVARFDNIEDAKNKAKTINGEKHAYYTKVTVKRIPFFDVRIEN